MDGCTSVLTCCFVCSSGESHFDTPIPIIVAVGAVVMLIAAVGLVVYKKKGERFTEAVSTTER